MREIQSAYRPAVNPEMTPVEAPRGESLAESPQTGILGLSHEPRGRALAYRAAVEHRVELTEAVDTMRKVYEGIGVDLETVERLVEAQAYGSDKQPLLKRNVVFTVQAAEAAAEVPTDVIAAARDANAAKRAANVEIFNARQKAVGGKTIPII
jgi:hypothetical protein